MPIVENRGSDRPVVTTEGELRAALEEEVWAVLRDFDEPCLSAREFLGSQIIGGVLLRVVGPEGSLPLGGYFNGFLRASD